MKGTTEKFNKFTKEEFIKMKRFTTLVVTFALLFSFSVSSVRAAEQFEVVGSGYENIVHSTLFSSEDVYKIDLNQGLNFHAVENITVKDLSGTNSGWKLTANFSDFVVMGIDDPCNVDGILNITVPVQEWLTLVVKDKGNIPITDQTIIATVGTDLDSSSYCVQHIIPSSGDITLLSVEPGFGAGQFDFNLDFTIGGEGTDSWLPVGTTINSTAGMGDLNGVIVQESGQKYQIFAGTYETTITYSISGNPAL